MHTITDPHELQHDVDCPRHRTRTVVGHLGDTLVRCRSCNAGGPRWSRASRRTMGVPERSEF